LNFNQKLVSLIDTIKKEPKNRILIFTATKASCSHLVDILKAEGIRCLELHGDKTQNYRDKSLKYFKDGMVNVLIATDLASRGLDIKNIDLVINFDMPRNIEDYIHRIGRTGRAGNKGRAISFFTNSDVDLTKDLINVLNLSKQEVPEQLKDIKYNLLEESRKKHDMANRKNMGQMRSGRRDSYGGGYTNNNQQSRYNNLNSFDNQRMGNNRYRENQRFKSNNQRENLDEELDIIGGNKMRNRSPRNYNQRTDNNQNDPLNDIIEDIQKKGFNSQYNPK